MDLFKVGFKWESGSGKHLKDVLQGFEKEGQKEHRGKRMILKGTDWGSQILVSCDAECRMNS